MPSPIAHTTMGYVIHKLYNLRQPRSNSRIAGLAPRLLVISIGLSLMPDLDSIAGLVFDDFAAYHNNGTHSLLIGLAVSLVIAGLAWRRKRSDFGYWLALSLLCYGFHVVLDFFTVGRGVMLFWPISTARFESPVKLFYGLHWSEGVFSYHHFVTLANELAFVALMILIVHLLERKIGRFKPRQQQKVQVQ